MVRRVPQLTRALLVLVIGSSAVLGCGEGSASTAAGDEPATAGSVDEPALPVTVTDDTGRAVTVSSVERIIPLDGDLAEIVFALGLGANVVATDLSATYPPEADERPEIGYQRALQPEPIVAFAPTVVLATDLAGPAEVVDQIAGLVPTVIVVAPDDLTGPATKIRAVARALGVPERGEALARSTQAEIDAALESVPPDHPELRVAALYLRGENVQQVFGPGSGVHALLDAIGAVDVGELLGVRDNQPVTEEAFVLHAPDVLLVTATGLESVGGIDGLIRNPAFSRTPAAQHGRVLAYETQYLLGFGPRTGALVRELVHDLYGAP